MSEDNTQQPEHPTPEQPSSDGTENTGERSKYIPRDRFDEVLGERNDLKRRLDALEAAETERQRKKLEEEGKHQEIIAALQPEAERAKQLEAQLLEYQKRDQAELDAELDALDADIAELLPSGTASEQLSWLRKAKRKGVFDKPAPRQTDAGATGDPKPPEKELPPQQQALKNMAAEYGFLRRGGKRS